MGIENQSKTDKTALLTKSLSEMRKPQDLARVVEKAAVRQIQHKAAEIEAKELADKDEDGVFNEVRETAAKAKDVADKISEKVVEAAAIVVPGGQVIAAEVVLKETVKTVAKEIGKAAVKEVASQAIDATESESLQSVKGKIVEASAAVVEKGVDGAHSRSGDAGNRMPIESPNLRVTHTGASDIDTANMEKKEQVETKSCRAEEQVCGVPESEESPNAADVRQDVVAGDALEKVEVAGYAAEKSVEGEKETSDLNGDQTDDAMAYVDEIPAEGSMEELLEQIAMADGDLSRLDDNGDLIKDPDGNLRPEIEFVVNGTRYETDERGRIIHAEGYLADTPDNGRDISAQSDAGGKDRKPGDDGGHLRARMNGGSSGNENLVAMRDTINRGDYKQSENEENQMLKEGKQVYEKVDITYEDDSARPSKIDKTYTDGEKTVKLTVDNVEGSTDLLEGLEGEISGQDLSNLKDEIADMQADGNEVSVTSVRREYDSEGNLKSITVGVTNETTTPREKNYTTYSPKA